MSRIKGTTDLHDLKDCDLVVETVSLPVLAELLMQEKDYLKNLKRC
jgi:hypothetical protein